MNNSTLPALAKSINEAFPEMGGRVLAVSESDITKENTPELPLVMLALAREDIDHNWQSNKKPEITEDFLVEFWLESSRYQKADGSESPFWSYYDYDAIQDKLIDMVLSWVSPKEGRLTFISMDIEATHFAVVLTFRFQHTYRWCRPEKNTEDCGYLPTTSDGQPFKLSSRIFPLIPPTDCECECEPQVDNCGKCKL